MPDTDPDLDTAYAIDGPEGARKLYTRAGPRPYDENFGAAYGYVRPARGRAHLTMHWVSAAPVLDVGGGNGACRAASFGVSRGCAGVSRPRCWPSRRARALSIVATVEADLTRTLPLPDGAYGGRDLGGDSPMAMSAPEALPELLRIVAEGALFVCGTDPTSSTRCASARRWRSLQGGGADHGRSSSSTSRSTKAPTIPMPATGGWSWAFSKT